MIHTLRATKEAALDLASELIDEGFAVAVQFDVYQQAYHVDGRKPQRESVEIPADGIARCYNLKQDPLPFGVT